MLPQRKPTNVVSERFTRLFSAHDIQLNQIPRLIPQITYEDLGSPKALLAALSPAVIDATAELFGIRSEWLEGLDDTPYQFSSAGGSPKTVLSRLIDAISARGRDQSWFPLRVLTTSMQLDRQGKHQQWLLPVIIETVTQLGETFVFRCHFFSNHYDWTNEAHRLELKAIVAVAYERFHIPAPLYQVTPKEMEQFMLGELIPSVFWRKGPLTEPSLEDFVLNNEQSRQAQETDELAKLQAYLDASHLRECRLEATPLLSKTATAESDAIQAAKAAAPAEPAKPDATVPTKPGKRQAQQANWDAILTAAQTIWTRPPYLSYADMIQRLKSMPHLKAAALSDSAIHKRLRPIAPEPVRGKPGRKPNQSA